MPLSVTFTAKFESVFVLTFEKAFSQSFHFKASRKSIGSSKDSARDFKNSTPFERSVCFYVTISESFKRFQYFNFFRKSFFRKLEYRFLVETTKIENTSFPFKTALSETNVKTNRMATIKWTYGPVNTLFFRKFFSSFRTS